MSVRQPQERASIIANILRKLSANGGHLSLEEAYGVFKEIEEEMRNAEDDREFHGALSAIRNELKKAMAVRAQELGKSEDWAKAMKGHDARLILNPLFRAARDDIEFVKVYRALTPAQLEALEYCQKTASVRFPPIELLEAELRWDETRRGTILRIIPDPSLTRTWLERLKAILVGILLTMGSAFAAWNRVWVAAVPLLAILFVVVGTWVRDLMGRVRLNKSTSAP